MYTLLKQFVIREELLKKGVKIFTPLEFGRIFKLPDHKIKYFLEKWTKEAFLVRLKQGLYAIKSDLPPEEEIANRMYQPSYLSFEYALAYYNILPEMPYAVTSASTKSTRTFPQGSKTYSYFKIKKNAYTGYILTKIGDKAFLIAEPEKALVDYLYFVTLNKKPFNDRLDITGLDKQKIGEYAKLYNRPKINGLLKKLK